MTVENILEFLNKYCPFSLAEEWDNVGLNVGRKTAEVTKVLVALDLTLETVRAAKEMGAQLIVTHHPLLFDPLRQVTDDAVNGERILALAENGIAHIACHTNLDAADGGVNDCLAAALGLSEVEPLGNLAKMGILDTTLYALADKLKKELPSEHCLGVCCNEQVHKVAIIGGSGGSMLQEAIDAGCDTFVTGELKYNHFLDGREQGINLLTFGHFETEYIVLAPLAEALQKAFPELDVQRMLRKAPMECF
ncbi:MAG: Nif3-like dinuclear metal center hexameric protein [Clostridia bacterium]|nr:Nif3-like dinuclear metal center hexameric protein [Clostridia bacterium]